MTIAAHPHTPSVGRSWKGQRSAAERCWASGGGGGGGGCGGGGGSSVAFFFSFLFHSERSSSSVLSMITRCDRRITIGQCAVRLGSTERLLECSVSGISCFLFAGCLLTRRGRAYLIQAGDNACLPGNEETLAINHNATTAERGYHNICWCSILR